jgi:hypothetical protein
MDEGEPLWLIVGFRKQLAITIKTIRRIHATTPQHASLREMFRNGDLSASR